MCSHSLTICSPVFITIPLQSLGAITAMTVPLQPVVFCSLHHHTSYSVVICQVEEEVTHIVFLMRFMYYLLLCFALYNQTIPLSCWTVIDRD